MSRSKAYIETTIIGFLTARSSRDIVTQSKQQTEIREAFETFEVRAGAPPLAPTAVPRFS